VSDLTFSFPTVHRRPNPQGAAAKISATDSGLAALIPVEVFNAGPLGSSLPTRGVWANVDLMSVATSGYLISRGPITPFETTLIYTEFGPLTTGDGSGELADIEDVTVQVNGVEVVVFAVDPVAGIIVLDDLLDPGDVVLLDYSYVSNPTIPFAALNNSNYLLNQYGSNAQGHPFPFQTVLAPYEAPQPQVIGHQWTAFDYEYSAVLNDPTSLVLNEPSFRGSLPPFQRNTLPTAVFFEGDDHPEGFTYTGPTLGAPAFTSPDSLYIIEDVSTGVDNSQGLASLFRRVLDLTFEQTSTLNWRTRVLSYTADGVFTGLGAGWADTERAYLTGFLELSGSFRTVGVLTSAGDETLAESWSGLTATVEAPLGVNTSLRFTGEPPLIVGSRIWSEGVIYTVLDVDDEGVDGYDVTVDVAFPSLGPVNLFVEADFTQLTSYRAAKSPTGDLEVFGFGFAPALARVAEVDAAVAPEIFSLLRQNSVFFGSLSRRAVNESGWDFVRYSVLPAQGREVARRVSVDTDMTVLPEADDPPWYVSQNQGWAGTLAGGLVQSQSAGQPLVGGGYNWVRIEPFIQESNLYEVSFRVRVSAWASGLAATVTLADATREAVVSLFDGGTPAQFQGADTLSKLTQGFWSQVNPISLATRGYLNGYNAPIIGDAFLYGYGGVTSPEDAGFTSTFDPNELSYLDHRLRITHDGVLADASAVEVGKGSITDWVCQTRFSVLDYTLDVDGLCPLRFGVDDGEFEIYLAPYDDGTPQLVLVDGAGSLVLDGGSVVGLTYDWQVEGLQNVKMVRTGDNLTVFVDGVYLGLIDVLVAPASGSADVSARFGVLDGQGTFEVDYFVAHQAAHEPRQVGLLTGSGSLLDASQYDVEDAEFFGSFLEVRLRVHTTSTVDVYLGGSATPALSVPYLDLPLRSDREGVDTDFGYIQFGTLDPQAYTEAQWDYVRYEIVNQREDQRTLPHAYLNQSNTLTSPEPTEDLDPEIVEITPYTSQILRVGQVGMFADRILSVTSQDGLTSYTFTYDRDTNEITLATPLTDLETALKVTLFHRKPYTKAYLKNNRPVIRLGEGTPPFALTHQATFTATEEFDDTLNDPLDRLLGNGDYAITEDGVTVVFRRDADAFLASLDLCSESVLGTTGLLSAACDSLCDIALLDPYEDVYTIPEQDDYLRHRGQILHLNDVDTVLNTPGANLLCLSAAVLVECEVVEEDALGAVTDEALTGGASVYSDFYGSSLLNNLKATLNAPVAQVGEPDSVIFTANSITSVDTNIDFTTPVNFP